MRLPVTGHASSAEIGARSRVPTRLLRSRRGRATVAAGIAAGLVALALLQTAAMLRWPSAVPWASYVAVVVVAGLFLSPRLIAVVYAGTAVCLAYAVGEVSGERSALPATVLLLVLVAWLMVWQALSRARLGVQGTRGESMLVDLRDRLRSHGELPALPAPWHAEVSLRSAYGQSFSGDFIVADRSHDGMRLEVVVVDVSGKGIGAGTRALLLSGAFGGLLGAMSPEEFMPAANSYLLRQQWPEGFATAIYVALDLRTGDYLLSSAGHPPAVQYSAGSGSWELLDRSGGPALGIVDPREGAAFPWARGRLHPGDALVLYTDGVIEARGRDLTVGIDRMLGAAERLVSHGFAGGAARLSSAARAGESDDRAVVLLWRT